MTPDLSDEQVSYLSERLGIDLDAQQQVANDVKDFFAERADEEELTPDEMLAVIRAVEQSVEEAIMEAEREVGGE